MENIENNIGINDNSGNKQRKSRNVSVHKWTNEENKKILDYLVNTVRSGGKIERPSPKVFYDQMINFLNFETCNYLLLYHKVRSFYDKYKSALKWREGVGQSLVKTLGEDFVKNIIYKRWPHFDIYEEIWGNNGLSDGSSSPKYGFRKSLRFNSETITYSKKTPVVNRTNPSLSSASNSDTNCETQSLSNEQNFRNESINDANELSDEVMILNDTDSDVSEEARPTAPSGVLETSISSQATDQNDSMWSLDHRTLANNNWDSYLEATKIREKGFQEKIHYKVAYLDYERQKTEAEFSLQRERFEFEKQMRERELLLKEKEIEAMFTCRQRELDLKEVEINKELKMKEMELNALKWKVELAKLQVKPS